MPGVSATFGSVAEEGRSTSIWDDEVCEDAGRDGGPFSESGCDGSSGFGGDASGCADGGSGGDVGKVSDEFVSMAASDGLGVGTEDGAVSVRGGDLEASFWCFCLLCEEPMVKGVDSRVAGGSRAGHGRVTGGGSGGVGAARDSANVGGECGVWIGSFCFSSSASERMCV